MNILLEKINNSYFKVYVADKDNKVCFDYHAHSIDDAETLVRELQELLKMFSIETKVNRVMSLK